MSFTITSMTIEIIGEKEIMPPPKKIYSHRLSLVPHSDQIIGLLYFVKDARSKDDKLRYGEKIHRTWEWPEEKDQASVGGGEERTESSRDVCAASCREELIAEG